jgi:MFS family permease
MVGAVGSIFNALSRLLWGWLLDHFTFKRLAIINLCVQIFISHTLDKAVTSSFGYAFYIWTIYIFYGGLYSMLPTLSSRIFGSKVGTQLYGVIFFGFVIACWLQYLSI